ncbi:30S ribosomal protein S1 [Botrimarina hoheduenensis]|uniref:30S ribosomal protein S1 n=1 Tax=Botrimarina hoheduenensis TaxID=2528000 RepID=A0A5C5WDG3_9BACT|nr:S1 RNA-binding domain-containing protein [Botrimarina hoheduenensis]TWT47722.1 30S ribosomal protein S1 [Botrimarina hoheduenensis]
MSSESQASAPIESSISSPSDERPTDSSAAANAQAGAESGDRPSERLRIGTQRDAQEEQPLELKPKPVMPVSTGAETPRDAKKYPPPNVRAQLSTEQEAELQAILAEGSAEDAMDSAAAPDELPPETKIKGRVLQVTGDAVIVDLGSNRQGLVPLKQFEVKGSGGSVAAEAVSASADEAVAPSPSEEAPAAHAPAEGTDIEVVVVSLNADEGTYELKLPTAAIDIGNWDEVQVGQTVEVSITSHNKGGLECKVSGIRAFMPMGQISVYRVENAEEYVGQKMTAVITEANRGKRNLILSHRAVMERDKAANREKLLAELAPGQTREGVVRSLRDFGVFVDLGGVDGMIHVSKLSWDRITHPKEVLSEGQQIKVKIDKIDQQTGKIALSYRESADNPWDSVEQDFPIASVARGKVSKIMDFGAFVRLKAGVEGLIHISELDHKRIHRVSDVLSEGQDVEVKVVSVDRGKQRIALSLKAMMAPPPKPEGGKKETEYADEPETRQPRQSFKGLKGGISTPTGGENFGLKW